MIRRILAWWMAREASRRAHLIDALKAGNTTTLEIRRWLDRERPQVGGGAWVYVHLGDMHDLPHLTCTEEPGSPERGGLPRWRYRWDGEQ